MVHLPVKLFLEIHVGDNRHQAVSDWSNSHRILIYLTQVSSNITLTKIAFGAAWRDSWTQVAYGFRCIRLPCGPYALV
jgi:hypothetical protein